MSPPTSSAAHRRPLGGGPGWAAAADGRPVDWEALFASYRAAVDWPACRFYAGLMAAYPPPRFAHRARPGALVRKRTGHDLLDFRRPHRAGAAARNAAIRPH